MFDKKLLLQHIENRQRTVEEQNRLAEQSLARMGRFFGAGQRGGLGFRMDTGQFKAEKELEALGPAVSQPSEDPPEKITDPKTGKTRRPGIRKWEKSWDEYHADRSARRGPETALVGDSSKPSRGVTKFDPRQGADEIGTGEDSPLSPAEKIVAAGERKLADPNVKRDISPGNYGFTNKPATDLHGEFGEMGSKMFRMVRKAAVKSGFTSHYGGTSRPVAVTSETGYGDKLSRHNDHVRRTRAAMDDLPAESPERAKLKRKLDGMLQTGRVRDALTSRMTNVSDRRAAGEDRAARALDRMGMNHPSEVPMQAPRSR